MKGVDINGLIEIFSIIDKTYGTKGEIKQVADSIDEIFNNGKKGQVLTKTDDSVTWEDSKLKAWKGTLEEYNNIGEKDDDTIYFVVGDINVGENDN